MKITITNEIKNRMNQAIKEAKQMLNKELSYSKDLQNLKRIEELKNHIKNINYKLNLKTLIIGE